MNEPNWLVNANTSKEQLEKQLYSQQTKLPDWGEEKQKKLKKSHCLIIGLGGLGSPVAQYLAMAGLGEMTLVDQDILSLSNLNRQSLYDYQDSGKKKVFLAKKRLEKINPFIKINAQCLHLDQSNYKKVFSSGSNPINLIIDATDNFTSTFLIHDLAFSRRINLIQANVYTFSASLNVFLFSDSIEKFREKYSCYRCLWKEIPSSKVTKDCDEVGVLGATVGIMGSYQAMLGLETILNPRAELAKFRKIFHFPEGKIAGLYWKKKDDCPLCSKKGDKKNGLLAMEELEKEIIKNFAKPGSPKSPLEVDFKAFIKKNPKESFYIYDLREVKNYTPKQKKILSKYTTIEKQEFKGLITKVSSKTNHKKNENKEKKVLVVCEKGNSSLNLVSKTKSQNPEIKIYSLWGGINKLI